MGSLGSHKAKFFAMVLGLWTLSLWPQLSSLSSEVRFINVTQLPIYFAVYYRKGFAENIVRAIRYSAPQEGFYTAVPGGQEFLSGTSYTHLPSTNFKWPGQICSSRGTFGDCRGHYARTVFFSFVQQDIIAGEVDFRNPQGLPSAYLGKDIGSALYHGWNVDAGETHFVFYNPYGFDPMYAAYEKKDKDVVVKAGKLNTCQADTPKANALRRYLLFADYQYFGK